MKPAAPPPRSLVLKSLVTLIVIAGLNYPVHAIEAEPPLATALDRIDIAYIPPKEPAHQPIHDLLRERKVLETLRDYLSPLRLPRQLSIKLDGCAGVANAWYDPERSEVVVCYEYIEDVVRGAPADNTPEGIDRADAIVGPTSEVFLHEIAHAIFDLLKIPVFGREEDAADQVAAYALLQLGADEARRAIVGVAYMLAREATTQAPRHEHFARSHGLPAQRFYNLVCMAYGAHPQLFEDIAKATLPPSRAELCQEEYEQVKFAFGRLITPHLDPERRKEVRSRKWLTFDTEPRLKPRDQ
jgi:hypothetical protein